MGKSRNLLKKVVIAFFAIFIIALVFIQMNAGKKNREVTQFLYRDYIINIKEFEEITVSPPPNEVNDESRLFMRMYAPYGEFKRYLNYNEKYKENLDSNKIRLILYFYREEKYKGIERIFSEIVDRANFLYLEKRDGVYLYKSDENLDYDHNFSYFFSAGDHFYKLVTNNKVYYFFCSGLPLGCVHTRVYDGFRAHINFALSDFPHFESFDQIARETTAKIVEDR